MTTHSLQESGPDAIRWQSLWCRAVFHQMGDLGNAGAWAPPGILFAFDLSEQSSPRAVPSTRVWWHLPCLVPCRARMTLCIRGQSAETPVYWARKGQRCCLGECGPSSFPGVGLAEQNSQGQFTVGVGGWYVSCVSATSPHSLPSLLWWQPPLKFIGIITYEKSVLSEDSRGWGWVADCNLMIRLKYAKANK